MSVVIATRNRVARLVDTLDRLTALPDRPEVVVVDNASTDGTSARVAERFPAVRLLTLPANRGASARTAGARLASHPYVAFSDDDSWWQPGALTAAARLLDAEPRLGLLAARTVVAPTGSPDPLNAVLAGSPLGCHPGPRGLPGPPVLGFLGCAAVARRAAFLQVGGYHPLLLLGAEETLLAYDLAAAGWLTCYAPRITAVHQPADGGRPGRAALVHRNELLTAWLRRPPGRALHATWALARRASADPAARRGLAQAALRLPAALRDRRVLPPAVERDVRRVESHPAPADRPDPVPGRPTGPTDPTGLTGLTGLTDPTDPTDPTGSTGLTDPADPADPTGLTGLTDPAGAAAAVPDRPADGGVTVVVITHDRRPELLHTLDRLARLPERPPVLVTDNGSTDGTAAAVARRHPGVRVLRPGANLGAVGRNLAVRHVTTRYTAFCDDDTWWSPGSLAGATALLDAHPEVAAVTARIVVEPGGVEDPIVAELRNSPLPRPPGLPGPALGSFLAGATVLRTDAFRAAGGFSPRLWLGGEEELLAMDLMAAGWWLVFDERLTLHHAPSTARDARRRRADGIRNTLWTTWLRRRPAAATRRTAGLLLRVPRDATSAAAVLRAAGGLPWLLRERRAVPHEVEGRLRLLDRAQRTSRARRYVG